MARTDTLVDKIVASVKNNRVAAWLIVLGMGIGAIAAFTGAVTGLLKAFRGPRPVEARAQLSQLGIAWTPASFVGASRAGDLEAVEAFLFAGMDPNVRDDDGYTALMWAAGEQHGEIVDAILARGGVDVDAEDDWGKTALSHAAFHGDLEIFEALVSHGVSRQTLNGAFVAAAESGRGEVFPVLLEAGIDLEETGPLALRAAAGSIGEVDEPGLDRTVDELLEIGIDANAEDEEGWTPLLLAADRGHLGVTKRLIDRGANLDARCDCQGYMDGGWSALMMAIHQEHAEVVEVLLAGGADVRLASHDGRTALMEAVGRDEVALVQALQARGADVNAAGSDGTTALMRAADFGTLEIVRALLESGADVDARDAKGQTALDAALSRREGDEEGEEIVRLLKSATVVAPN